MQNGHFLKIKTNTTIICLKLKLININSTSKLVINNV